MPGGGALAWGLLLSLLLLAVALGHLWRLSRSRSQRRSRLRVVHPELSDMRGRDALTGLVTGAGLELLLEPEVLRADREGTPLDLLYVGLDGVRAVNESCGLRVGDGLLAAAAALHERLTRPFTVEMHTLELSASIGIACDPEHGSRPRLISHAALAMRAVKLGGGAGQAMYDTAMGVNMREQAEQLQELRQVLARQDCSCTSSPRSMPAACSSRRPGPCCVGSTRSGAWSAQRFSCRWPSATA